MTKHEEYLGFKEVCLSNEELAALYEGTPEEDYGCVNNEYLIATGCDGKENYFKFFDGSFTNVPYTYIKNEYTGTVKPRNPQQRLALDMLQDERSTVKVITGKFGVGKDFLMCSAALDLIRNNKFKKIVYVRNNIEVKNSKPVGFLPGSYDDKLLPFAMPLADHIGGADALKMMIDEDLIEVVHLGFIRGRDIKDSIIICSEAENMTKEHIQLLLGRVGEGSSLWLNGDFKQCDSKVFTENSGLSLAIEKLKGHPRFSYVKLLKTERSETAAMADLLD